MTRQRPPRLGRWLAAGWTLMRDLPRLTADRGVVNPIIGLAKHLDPQVIVEGLGWPEQRDYQTAEGCDLLQGLLLIRPIPAAEVLAAFC